MNKFRRIVIFLIAAVMISAAASGCGKEDSGAYDRGLKALAREDFDTALTEFQAAADNDDRKAESYRGQGIVYYRRGDYKYAVSLFEMSLEEMKHTNDEFREDVLFYLASAYERNHQTDDALSVYEELCGMDRAGLAYARIGRVYLNINKPDEARENFSQALETEKSYEVYLVIYEAYAAKGLEADGAAYLEEALQIVPDSSKEYALQGKVYAYLEEKDEAKKSLNTAIEGGYYDAVPMLGHILLEEGDIAGAREIYKKAVDEQTSISQGYNGLALCAMEEGDYPAALSYISAGLQYGDEEASKSLRFNEIIVYERMLDYETARQKAAEFLSLYPTDEKAKEEFIFLTR